MRLFAVWVQAGLKTLIRTPRSAFFTLVFPMILLLLIDSTNSGSVTAAGGKVDFAQYFTPSLAIFGLSFACYTSLVFSIPRAREQGILKRVRGTPLRAVDLPVGPDRRRAARGTGLRDADGDRRRGRVRVHLYLHLLPAAASSTLVARRLAASAALGIAVSSFVARCGNRPGRRERHAAAARLHLGRLLTGSTARPGWVNLARRLLPAQPSGRRVLGPRSARTPPGAAFRLG